MEGEVRKGLMARDDIYKYNCFSPGGSSFI